MQRPSRLTVVAPVLLAVVPVLTIAATNVGEYTAWQLASVLVVWAALGGIVSAIVSVALRRRPRPQKTLVASVAALFVLAGPQLAIRVTALPPRFALVGVASVAVLLIWMIVRDERSSPTEIERATAIFAAVLVVWTAVSAYRAHARVDRLLVEAPTARALLASLPPPRAAGRPDIYVVVLDNLANARVQREVFGRSNRVFEDSLRALGFLIPPDVHSSYSWTPHSVASLLDLGEVRGLEADLGASSTDWALLYRLIQRNRSARWLAAMGYTVYFEPSVGFAGTLTLDAPHVRYGEAGKGALAATLARNRLFATAVSSSVPGRLANRLGWMPRYTAARERALRTLADVAAERGPKLVLAHSLVAHEPFVVDDTCAPRRGGLATGSEDRAGYRLAVGCTERLVLEAVTRILRTAPSPPIIILQADHGPMSRLPPLFGPAESISGPQAEERMGAFGAYLLPGTPAAEVPAAPTPSNVLRFVFSRYFGVALPPLPDSSFYVSIARPFHFIDVTALRDSAREAAAGARPGAR